jgi:ABC-type Fe3+ transport system substrate-binding protein
MKTRATLATVAISFFFLPFVSFSQSKEGQEMLLEFQRIPVRKDVEPKPARLFRGYQRIVEKPDDYKYFSDNVKLYQEIFKTR